MHADTYTGPSPHNAAPFTQDIKTLSLFMFISKYLSSLYHVNLAILSVTKKEVVSGNLKNSPKRLLSDNYFQVPFACET